MAERAKTTRQDGADVTGAHNTNFHSGSFGVGRATQRRHETRLGSMWDELAIWEDELTPVASGATFGHAAIVGVVTGALEDSRLSSGWRGLPPASC